RGPPQASGALGTVTAAASAPASGIAGQSPAGAVASAAVASVVSGAAASGAACACTADACMASGSQAASAQARSIRLQGIDGSPGDTNARGCCKTAPAATAGGHAPGIVAGGSVFLFLELHQHVHVEGQ